MPHGEQHKSQAQTGVYKTPPAVLADLWARSKAGQEISQEFEDDAQEHFYDPDVNLLVHLSKLSIVGRF